MKHRQILTCLFILAIIPLSAKAFPPVSPAGGNYLVLDGVDDYAVLDFKTFGVLLPKDTDEFTVEAWVYPTTPPDGNIYADSGDISRGILMKSVSRRWLVMMSAKTGLRRVVNLKKTMR